MEKPTWHLSGMKSRGNTDTNETVKTKSKGLLQMLCRKGTRVSEVKTRESDLI